MASPILKALASGYSADMIVKMLIKQFPQHASKIQQAVNMGFGPADILKYLVGGRKELMNDKSSLTEHEKSANLDEQRRGNVEKAALGVGAAGLAGIAGIGMLGRTAAQALPSTIPPIQPIPPAGIPTTQQAINQQAIQRAVPGTGIPQPTSQIAAQSAMQPQQPVPPNAAQPSLQPQQAISGAQAIPQPNQSVQLAQKANLMPHIEELQKRYQDPKQIAALLYQSFPKEMKKLQEDAGKPMEEVIADIVQTAQRSSESPASSSSEGRLIGSEVVTKNGDIGKISKISGETGQLETEEGKKGAKLSEIEKITPEVNDVLENYKRLINSLPEEYKSQPLNFIGYDPERKKLSFRYNTGDQYVYENIPEEEAQAIANALHVAKTEGEGFYGSWSPGDPSRGAGAHKLIMELQKKYGGKGKEYSAKFKTLYDYMALPKQLLKEEMEREKIKKKEEKENERRKKKAKKGTS